MIITSNRAPSDWYPLFPNPVVAESLLDRLINTSHQAVMNGPSYRPNKRPKSPTDKPPTGSPPADRSPCAPWPPQSPQTAASVANTKRSTTKSCPPWRAHGARSLTDRHRASGRPAPTGPPDRPLYRCWTAPLRLRSVVTAMCRCPAAVAGVLRGALDAVRAEVGERAGQAGGAVAVQPAPTGCAGRPPGVAGRGRPAPYAWRGPGRGRSGREV
ncbi:ATP-binding protein [Streptomyces nodosus]|uniref:ATP-binding protein n=1 Tax=Streptomyces nodosus TaxID=40318 RepID=UPI0037FB1B3F